MLPLLRYWLSSRVNKVLMLCKFRKFQFLNSHFFEVNELLDEHWSKFVQMKLFQLQSISNAIDVLIKGLRSRNLVFRV